MPTAPTHAVAALAIGAGFYRPGVPKHLLAVGAACAALPDLDVLGFRAGIVYGDLLGHRGLSHSLVFAATLAWVIVRTRYRLGAGPLRPWAVWLFLALATASHGLLDALTDGGLGIAFFSPLETGRFFFPLRPIAVAPIGLAGLFQPGMLRVVETELIWVWCPSTAVALLFLAWRRTRRADPAAPWLLD
jgi:inner membrane protein